MQKPIAITAISSISPIGNDSDSIWQHYQTDQTGFSEKQYDNLTALTAAIDDDSEQLISDLRQSDSKYKNLDRSVLLAMIASRQAVKKAGWKDKTFGINIGSSRGATGLYEKHHRDYLESGRTQTLASPTTTLGNISSWVSHDLQTDGPVISHSITCSTALHALLNGVAWLRAGMAERFLVGGSEAPLTGFTIAQMQAMKIYAKENTKFPCRAGDLEKKQNTMILGEAASVCTLETATENAIAIIEGLGYATEILEHPVSISSEADCFQKSMRMAIGETPLSEIDAIVMHAPGTIAGDISEYKAIAKIFGDHLPLLTTNKWKTGHTFGASGLLSVEFAVMMLQNQKFIGVPFVSSNPSAKPLNKILVNAVGFGGNAVSVLLSRP